MKSTVKLYLSNNEKIINGLLIHMETGLVTHLFPKAINKVIKKCESYDIKVEKVYIDINETKDINFDFDKSYTYKIETIPLRKEVPLPKGYLSRDGLFEIVIDKMFKTNTIESLTLLENRKPQHPEELIL